MSFRYRASPAVPFIHRPSAARIRRKGFLAADNCLPDNKSSSLAVGLSTFSSPLLKLTENLLYSDSESGRKNRLPGEGDAILLGG